ncbi:MAG: hypothetical protein BGO44_04605 [Legionella sp. 39-23]|nr:MAG: hypothetical protein BGO44_04605 [Legionella sp. 39-23]
MFLIYLFYGFYLLTNLVLVNKLSSVIRTIKENEVIMIHLNQTNAPLELAFSLNDLLRALMLTSSSTRNQDISYSYWNRLSIKEAIGTYLELNTLVHYPQLCNALRRLERLDYQVELSLGDIPEMNQQGIESMIYSLETIKNKLLGARTQKATLDAQFNKLVYLYGQNTTVPVLRAFKPYYYLRRTNYYNQYTTRARKINISGVPYFMHYHGHRLQKLKNLHELNEHHLLSHYFDATKQDTTAITPTMRTYLLGGFINTSVFAFRSKYDYKQAGKKYYIDLATNKTYTRLNDAKDCAFQYCNSSSLILLEAY